MKKGKAWIEWHDKPGEYFFWDEYAAAELLDEDVLFLNSMGYMFHKSDTIDGHTLVLYVNANDVFAWGCAEGCDIELDELENLYDMYQADNKWGAVKWCCIKRNLQPQPPMKKDMIRDGAWGDELEVLPENVPVV